MFHVRGVFRIFNQEEGTNTCHFFKRSFLAELILSKLSDKNDAGKVQGHAPTTIF